MESLRAIADALVAPDGFIAGYRRDEFNLDQINAGRFIFEMWKESADSALFDDTCLQFFQVRDRMKDGASGLYYHAMDESRIMGWSNPETGLSPHIWGRPSSPCTRT